MVDSLGWAQFKLGRLVEAEATLRRAAELSPFSPEVRKHLGEVLVKQGKLAEAADYHADRHADHRRRPAVGIQPQTDDGTGRSGLWPCEISQGDRKATEEDR